MSPQLAVMSIEYTIDIQLTELGFPDILQPQETSVRETPRRTTSDGSFSLGQSPAANTRGRTLLVRERQSADAKQTSNTQQTPPESTPSETLESKPLDPPPDPQGEPGARGTGLSEPTAGDAELGSTDQPRTMVGEEKEKDADGDDDDDEDDEEEDDDDDYGDTVREPSAEMQQDDSDDSDVSEAYEEEEVDEEEEEEVEEGLDNGMAHSQNELLLPSCCINYL